MRSPSLAPSLERAAEAAGAGERVGRRDMERPLDGERGAVKISGSGVGRLIFGRGKLTQNTG